MKLQLELKLGLTLLALTPMWAFGQEQPDVTLRVTDAGLFWNEAQLSSVAALREWVQGTAASTRIQVQVHVCTRAKRLLDVLDVFRTSHLPRVGLATYGGSTDVECMREQAR